MPDWLQAELDRPYHAAAQLFPLLEGADFDQLKADIAEHGQLEPVTLHPDGSILDGRNRHRACVDLEIEPRFETWTDNGSVLAFVISKNIMRRHLTSSQRAALSVQVLPMLEEEARKRMVAGVAPDPMEKVPQGPAREQAAVLFQTNDRYVQVAKTLQEQAPDLLEQVKTGEKTMAAARWELTKRERQENPPLPTENKYRVFYADPPWQYERAELDDYGHTRRHYPSMSIDELCALGPQIQQMAEKDAVLWLWVTSPMLKNAFPLIDAWGFAYKTSFVWDKVGHNYGHYNSVRHEFLLIATRGSCTPDVATLFDSVQTIEKSAEHSEKPERFREIIDAIYTHGNKIELFARTTAAGWQAWGNEPGQHDTG